MGNSVLRKFQLSLTVLQLFPQSQQAWGFFVCLFFSFLIFRESILCLEMRSSGWEYKTTITGYKSFPAHDSSGPFCLGLTKALLFFKEMECVGHFDLLF